MKNKEWQVVLKDDFRKPIFIEASYVTFTDGMAQFFDNKDKMVAYFDRDDIYGACHTNATN